MESERDDDDAALAALADGARWLASMPTRPGAADLNLELEVSRLTRLGYAGKHAEAQEAAVRILDTAPTPQRVLSLVCPTGLGLLQSGRFDDAWRIVRRYRPVAATSRAAHRGGAAELAFLGFLAQLWAGEITTLEGLASSGLDLAHSTIPWAGASITRGLLAAACGAWSAARRELRLANGRLPLHDVRGAAAYGRAAEALAAAASGEAADARALLAVVEDMPQRASAVLGPQLSLLRLDTLIWLRDDNAPGAARSLAERSRTGSAACVELEALHRVLLLTPAGAAAGGQSVLDRIHELQPQVRSTRAAAVVHHADALLQRDDDLLGIAERELNRHGLWLPPGPRASALTAREREIAALAKARLTSRSIATRLGLSTRTVDSHLASVFMKLGVTCREDLGLALH